MEIRKATKKDIPQLSELFQQEIEYHWKLAQYYELRADFDWLNYVEEKLKRSNGFILVCEYCGNLGGFIDIKIHNYAANNRCRSILHRIRHGFKKRTTLPIKPLRRGVIEECFVVPSFRRRGIGSRLVKSALKWFQSKKIQRIELSLIVHNKGGTLFWKRFGFEAFRISLAKEFNNKNREK
ncbi:MAG: GNAT family N-acetyltransferase [Candidatus Scalindua sp.]|nr:GNAT family N-acetyltransferase [Candidatus Scalindua sp.]